MTAPYTIRLIRVQENHVIIHSPSDGPHEAALAAMEGAAQDLFGLGDGWDVESVEGADGVVHNLMGECEKCGAVILSTDPEGMEVDDAGGPLLCGDCFDDDDWDDDDDLQPITDGELAESVRKYMADQPPDKEEDKPY